MYWNNRCHLGGVHSKNTQRLLYDEKTDVKVLRLRKPDEITLHRAVTFARQKVGTAYSIREALLAEQKQEAQAKQPKRQFCTRFVAQAYESAGVKLVENAAYCNPEELLQSPLLEEVEEPLRVANDYDIEFANSEDPTESQENITNEIFEKSRAVAKDDIQTFEELSRFVIENPDKESEINAIIEESGYLTILKDEDAKYPWLYDPAQFINHFDNIDQLLGTALGVMQTEAETRQRFEETLETSKMGYALKKQRCFEVQIELCENFIERSYKREETAYGPRMVRHDIVT